MITQLKLSKFKLAIIGIIIFSILECSVSGYIGFWRDWFWTAVQNKDSYLFWKYLLEFTITALIGCFAYGLNTYLQYYSALLWRNEKTKQFFDDAAYDLNKYETEGFSQRIQEDLFNYPLLIISLVTQFFKNFINIIIFGYMLITKLGLFYFILPIIYVISGTGLAHIIANPLVKLNYINQVAEAKFRQILDIISYKLVISNNLALFKKTKHLNYFQTFYNQITVIIPYIILWFSYQASKITFGSFMQCASAMNEMINSSSFFINSYNDINKMRSCRKRLKEISII